MATCIALLTGELRASVMQNWLNTDVFEEHILHVEQLQGVTVAEGRLEADVFEIPEGIDPKAIAGLAMINCKTGDVLSYGFQVPALGISCLPSGLNTLCLRGWCEAPKTVEEYESDCSILDDPCALYKELRCCYYNLIKKKQKVSVSFRDRRVQYQPHSEADVGRLLEMMMTAKNDCECGNGEWRGGYMGHSCAPFHPPRGMRR